MPATHYVSEFERYKVNLCLNGHDHMYEHSVKSNVHYMTLSTVNQQEIANANPYSVTCIKKKSAAALLALTGNYCTVTVSGYASGKITDANDFVITNASMPSPASAGLLLCGLLLSRRIGARRGARLGSGDSAW